MTESPTKREDAEIWADWQFEASELVRELTEALNAAKAIKQKIDRDSNLSPSGFRSAEKRVYAAYRRVGTMSALIDEIDDDE